MAEPVRVFVGVGSNIDPEASVPRGLALLADRLGPIRCSPTYRCDPVGFEGDPFHNLVVELETGLAPRAVYEALRAIEADCGRDRGESAGPSRTLDLDLLTYGDLVLDEPGLEIPRGEILEYAFVLKPLSDLAGQRVHPTAGRTYAALWDAFEGDREGLEPVTAKPR